MCVVPCPSRSSRSGPCTRSPARWRRCRVAWGSSPPTASWQGCNNIVIMGHFGTHLWPKVQQEGNGLNRPATATTKDKYQLWNSNSSSSKEEILCGSPPPTDTSSSLDLHCFSSGKTFIDPGSKYSWFCISLDVAEAAVVALVDLVDLRGVLRGAVDDVGLAVGAPADHGAVVVGDVAAHRLVLLLREVLAAPDEDAERNGGEI